VKLTGHTCVLQQFDKYILQKPELINFADIRQKDILTLDGLEKGQLIQLDDVTRIKALRNQGRLAQFACYLIFKIGNFEVDVNEII
jgi:hypothetical protein